MMKDKMKVIYCTKEYQTPSRAAMASGFVEPFRIGVTDRSAPREDEEQVAEIMVTRHSLPLPVFKKKEDIKKEEVKKEEIKKEEVNCP